MSTIHRKSKHLKIEVKLLNKIRKSEALNNHFPVFPSVNNNSIRFDLSKRP